MNILFFKKKNNLLDHCQHNASSCNYITQVITRTLVTLVTFKSNIVRSTPHTHGGLCTFGPTNNFGVAPPCPHSMQSKLSILMSCIKFIHNCVKIYRLPAIVSTQLTARQYRSIDRRTSCFSLSDTSLISLKLEKLRWQAADVTGSTKVMHKRQYSSANANSYGSINVTKPNIRYQKYHTALTDSQTLPVLYHRCSQLTLDLVLAAFECDI